MKKAKKLIGALCAAAMVVLSVSAFAAAADATKFTDAAQIEHWDAVYTMAALGVIEGKDSGAFDPAAPVTRAEMAKMICLMRNGGVEPLWGSDIPVVFPDAENHWAKNYIAWCANKGVISGRGDGTFDPDATVTGAEAAKMALVALGYEAEIFKLTGPRWEDNTNVLANTKRLYRNIKALDTSVPLNRDNTAQVLYNTLSATAMISSWDSVSTTGEITYKYNEGDKTFFEVYFDVDVPDPEPTPTPAPLPLPSVPAQPK